MKTDANNGQYFSFDTSTSTSTEIYSYHIIDEMQRESVKESKMEIRVGDFVTIVGHCEATENSYCIVDDMRRFINDGQEHEVEYLDADDPYKIEFSGFMWHIDDVRLVRKENGDLVSEEDDFIPPEDEDITLDASQSSSFFKFDEKLIKSII